MTDVRAVSTVRPISSGLISEPDDFFDEPEPLPVFEPEPEPKQPTDLFRRWTAAELVDSDLTFNWLARGALTSGTYGMTAGELKTLKSHVGAFLDVAVASGTALFDRFAVESPGPVLKYVGEGGRIPHTRLLSRVAEAMGVTLRDLPIVVSYDVAPILSDRFTESLTRDLHEIEPVLFSLDPYYAFHGARTDSRNLHEEGGLLTAVSGPCVEAGVTCWITNHFNQTGSGNGLTRITQAGSGEWADSWWLVSHRDPADVAHGRFKLRLDIGSRQWGGSSWDLDLNVGAFDDHLNGHDGPITWDIRRADASDTGSTRGRVLAAVQEQPGEHTKEDLAKRAGGKLVDARKLIDRIETEGLIWPQLVQGKRSDGRSMTAWRYFPAHTPGTTHETDIGNTSRPGRPETQDDT